MLHAMRYDDCTACLIERLETDVALETDALEEAYRDVDVHVSGCDTCSRVYDPTRRAYLSTGFGRGRRFCRIGSALLSRQSFRYQSWDWTSRRIALLLDGKRDIGPLPMF